MKTVWQWTRWSLMIILGSVLFSLGFVWFLDVHQFNGGGITGIAQIVSHWTFGSVGLWVLIFNIPLFIIGAWKLGVKFFVGSLLGLGAVTAALELLVFIPAPETEPLLACIYGGALVGGGLGIVVMTGASTGGSDIIVRLLKRKWRNVPIGTITMGFDIVVMVLTGIAFGNMKNALYTGITVFLSGKVMDVVIYSFDYSKVAMIISDQHEKIAEAVIKKLVRGVTYLEGEGAYSKNHKKVILTVVKRHQLAELKQTVVDIDPDAFVILQEAHQVLGDGFSRYTEDSL